MLYDVLKLNQTVYVAVCSLGTLMMELDLVQDLAVILRVTAENYTV